ncbi:MAG TPA: TMEM165/GDT1 family protein [Steroidobacteraceae bacterium]|nr:TMEM165/GDT1 family protein [Steroidobacteraceae bacterium]
MDLKSLAAVFGTVLLAELGDKTQLATFLFATRNPADKWLVFAAAAGALVVAAGLAVLAGGFVAQHVSTRVLTRIAGVAFILIGAWTLWRA